LLCWRVSFTLSLVQFLDYKLWTPYTPYSKYWEIYKSQLISPSRPSRRHCNAWIWSWAHQKLGSASGPRSKQPSSYRIGTLQMHLCWSSSSFSRKSLSASFRSIHAGFAQCSPWSCCPYIFPRLQWSISWLQSPRLTFFLWTHGSSLCSDGCKWIEFSFWGSRQLHLYKKSRTTVFDFEFLVKLDYEGNSPLVFQTLLEVGNKVLVDDFE